MTLPSMLVVTVTIFPPAARVVGEGNVDGRAFEHGHPARAERRIEPARAGGGNPHADPRQQRERDRGAARQPATAAEHPASSSPHPLDHVAIIPLRGG